MLNRRDFSRYLLTGGVGILAPGAAVPARLPAVPQQNLNQDLDLLIEGGTVIDPGQNLHEQLDVAVKDGKVLDVSKNIAKERAAKVFSVKGRIVTPGFIDVHVHCFEGVS